MNESTLLLPLKDVKLLKYIYCEISKASLRKDDVDIFFQNDRKKKHTKNPRSGNQPF